jgi:cystathionine beta-synthase
LLYEFEPKAELGTLLPCLGRRESTDLSIVYSLKRQGINFDGMLNLQYHENVLELIGNTPLVKINRVGADARCLILAKLEYLNPGGSVKDRIGVAMVNDAERKGLLKPGGTIVEPTSGNTGMGLALTATIRGYKAIFTMPDKMSEEKRRLLRALGARVVIAPTNVPPDSPENYYNVARRIAHETPNAYMPDQYTNPNNPLVHYNTTGPEIWKQTEGKVDVVVIGMGTGGTITGVGKYLKERKPEVKVVGVDPEGSIFHPRFNKIEGSIHPYKVEGIGEDFMPKTLVLDYVDEVIQVSDKDSFLTARRLAREEGLLVGGSAGAAMYAALQVSKTLPKDKVVVVVFPDTGRNYLSKMYSDEWMLELGYIEGGGEGRITVGAILSAKPPGVPATIAVTLNDSLARAVELMRKHDVSQLPVIEDGHVLGTVYDDTVMKKLLSREASLSQPAQEVMDAALPSIDSKADISELYKHLTAGHNAVVVTREGKAIGVLTKMDVIAHLSKRT